MIVQNRETQFDAPLYQRIQLEDQLALMVIYTESPCSIGRSDTEIGRPPLWDHLKPASYRRIDLARTDPLTTLRLALRLKRSTPRLVLICGYYPRSHLLLALLLRGLGVRIGLRSDNTLSHTHLSGWSGWLRRLVVGRIQRLFHTWHPVGAQAEQYLRCLSGVVRPCYRFAYAVDNDWLAAASEQARRDRNAFLQQQNWPEDAFIVLGIMKWSPREDPLTLIQAVRLALQTVSNLRLILVGDGPLRAEVTAACSPIASSVLCPGYQAYSQLPIWYSRADLFVHPAPDEPWGVSVNEALACGVPVLAAAGVGAASEMLSSALSGGGFANGDVHGLAAQIIARAEATTPQDEITKACKTAAEPWHYRHTMAAFAQALK